jgi:hypothetical protein
MTSVESDAKNWRLRAKLALNDASPALHGLLGRFRGPNVDHDVDSAVPREVVVTHDGELLFVYAADEGALKAARAAVERALRNDGIGASFDVSHWDDAFDEWRQVDPPLDEEQHAKREAGDRDALAPVQRTLVANVGREIRVEFEQSLERWATQLGVECKIVEHPHLLQTQVAFEVRGPRRKIDEFVQGLEAEERQTLRNERLVMTSPL